MKEILQEKQLCRSPGGEALVEIGTELAAGRIENALGRLEAAQQQYLAWAELDQAIIDIQGCPTGRTPWPCSRSDGTGEHHPRQRLEDRNALMAVADKERKLAATLSDPVLWGKPISTNRDGSGRDYWPHQVEDLRCPAKNIIPPRRPGRGQVHRALDRRAPLRLHHPGGQGLIAAPHQGHLDTIIERSVPARQQPGSDEQHRS